MSHELAYIGRGKEHKVFRNQESGEVVKIPHLYNALMLRFLFGGLRALVQEIDNTIKTVEGTNGEVQVPKTRITSDRKSYYIIRQEFIAEDRSINDIRTVLQKHRLTSLVTRYDVSPDNFASQGNVVYVIDPTKNPFTRIIDRFGIIDEQKKASIVKRRNQVRDILRRRKTQS